MQNILHLFLAEITAMVDLRCTLWLFIAMLSISSTDTAFNSSNYIPQITLKPVLGKVTATTFVLDIPQCVFSDYAGSDIWLVIAKQDVALTLSDSALANKRTYNSFFGNGYYHIQPYSGITYPCSNDFNYTRVGNGDSCNEIEFCNGPLNSSLAYRVKFIRLNGTTLLNSTQWSAVISLMTARNRATIDTWPGRRSGGMIVITTILSICIAVFLAGLIATFIVGSKGHLTHKTVEKIEVPLSEEIKFNDYQGHSADYETNIPKI
ncbi:Hypothetical predicted protein [Pelobates cultripes]|uniref:Uncharacterized protein n=2 Tax=Pelobates cultripes TaxID=61616 RepID=A0AAD1R3F0_PELCU|nr:Hypothetical predicted protein [Pelobates cultripes]CAH2222591.1 Hypothetical predicted protein [Pelobates cultripes]